MKRRTQTFLTLILGIALGTTGTAFAAPAKQLVQATFDKINFVVNGESKTLTNDPLVYKGVTYLPMRTMLNTLGYEVGYDAKTKTISATSIDEKNQEEKDKEDMKLTDLLPVESRIKDLKESIKTSEELIDRIKDGIKEIEANTNYTKEQKEQMVQNYNQRIKEREEVMERYKKKLVELESQN